MAPIIVVNNYVDYPQEEKICRHTSSPSIMFLGKMDYEPNVTAVTYFVKYIYPELKNRFKELTFQIVGAKPAAEIQEFGKIDGIEITGFVESTESYFQNAAVVIAPMLSGAGVQNKIIQAMSYGCCVATTTIGAEGLDLKGDEVAILNSAEDWIEGLEKLLKDKTLRATMGHNARVTIKRTLSKEVIYKQFCELFLFVI